MQFCRQGDRFSALLAALRSREISLRGRNLKVVVRWVADDMAKRPRFLRAVLRRRSPTCDLVLANCFSSTRWLANA